jgi:hypothetical protein
MTFLFLPPALAWVLIAAAAAAAAGLFLIRPRPPRRVVPSLLVWRRVLDHAAERSWWDRVRWFVSLVLTLLIAVAIAAAFARPAPGFGTTPPGRVLIVLDSSWTMHARMASGGTRWGRAMQGAQALARASRGAEIALATTAEGVIEGPTSDLALVQSAFGRLRPSGGVEGAWPQVAGVTAVHFFTDGALARIMPADVVLHPIVEAAPNVAITAFEVQPELGPGGMASVFLAVANHAPGPQSVRVTVGRASETLFDRSIDIGVGETHRDVIRVPSAGDPRFRAHLTATDNALGADDDATAWLWIAEPLRVAVVGASSPLPSLLARDASLRVSAVERVGYAQAKTDVWVFDGWLPAEPPSKPALLIDPPASSWLGTRGPEETSPVWSTGAAHPILDGVDPTLVHIGHARPVVRPALQPVALSEQGTPLIAVEDTRTNRHVVFGFPVADSNLALTPAFPVLMANAIDWLGRPSRDLHRQPGPAVLPAATVRLLAPDGGLVPLTRLADRVTANLEAPGLYLVQSSDGQSVMRVTLGDMRRSNLLVSSVAAEPPSPPVVPAGEGRPWWIYATIVAFGLVTAEWITWQRRVTV